MCMCVSVWHGAHVVLLSHFIENRKLTFSVDGVSVEIVPAIITPQHNNS